ncbi:hypothetical protein LCGC14_2092350, partial [marine sediment metagenome]
PTIIGAAAVLAGVGLTHYLGERRQRRQAKERRRLAKEHQCREVLARLRGQREILFTSCVALASAKVSLRTMPPSLNGNLELERELTSQGRESQAKINEAIPRAIEAMWTLHYLFPGDADLLKCVEAAEAGITAWQDHPPPEALFNALENSQTPKAVSNAETALYDYNRRKVREIIGKPIDALIAYAAKHT